MKDTAQHQTLIPALDALIGDPDIIHPLENRNHKKAERLIIPYGYLTRIEDFYGEASTRGDSCHELMHHFSTMRLSLNYSGENGHFIIPNGTRIEFRDTDEYKGTIKGLSKSSTKAQAIIAAKMISKSVAVWTGSDRQISFSAAHDIHIARINAEPYTGRRTVTLSFDDSGAWYSAKDGMPLSIWQQIYPNEPQLHANEFIEFKLESKSEGNTDDFDRGYANIGRFDAKDEVIKPLEYVYNMRYGLFPRTPGQAMLNEALLSDIPLVIVSGVFGTGKTFLTVADGLAQVEKNGPYESVFICPRDGNLGREIGFLPGDKYAKIKHLAAPITDNLREVLAKKGYDKPKDNKSNDNEAGTKQYLDKAVSEYIELYFEYEALIFMGGRSLSRRFIIYDEFQDMERGQAKAILSRIGDGSKIVAMGDPTQVTNPHLSRTSNGLAYTASRVASANEPSAIVVTLTEDEIVRSLAARTVAKIFK